MSIFCYAPWNHLHIRSDKTFALCSTSLYRNIEATCFEEHWNSDFMKQIRLDMINNTPPEEICEKCIGDRCTSEPYFKRRNNWTKGYEQEILEKTKSDGSTTYLPRTLEIRTDLCNFSCRTCTEVFSTTHRMKKIKNNLKVLPVGNIDTMESIGLTDELLKRIIYIFWPGGEPFMSPVHWETMDRLIHLKKTDITIAYYTNLSFPGKTLYKTINLLKNFKKVRFNPSLDGTGEIGEYIREGLDYQKFLENLTILKKEFPNFPFVIGYTATSIGLLSLIDVLKMCLELNIDFEGRKSVFNNIHSLSINCLKPEVIKTILAEANDFAKGTRFEKQIKEYCDFLLYMYDLDGPLFTGNHAEFIEEMLGKPGFYKQKMNGLTIELKDIIK